MSTQAKIEARVPAKPAVREKKTAARSARHLRVVRTTAPAPVKPVGFWKTLWSVLDSGALATAASLPYSSLAQGSFGGY